MIGVFSDEMRRDPFPLYARLRATSPAFQVPGAPMWMLLDYASVKRALMDGEAFSSAAQTPSGPPPDWMIFTDPPRHTKLRALVLKAFTSRAVAALEARIRELSLSLLQPLVARGEFDLIGDFAGPLPAMVIAEVLGVPARDRGQYLEWVEAISLLAHVIDGSAAAGVGERYVAARAEMRSFLEAQLEARRRAPCDDLLSNLLTAEVDGERLSVEEIFGFFQLLIFAGTETTVNLIGNTVICLDDNPAALAELRARPDLTPQALEEVLRYRPSATFAFRQARRDLEIHGKLIPKGAMVLPVVAAANRDPAVFHDPEAFDIHRDPNPHLAFGHGPHFCLGAALARLEARVAVGQLIELAPELKVAQDEPWRPRPSLIIHGARALRVRTPRAKPPGLPTVEPGFASWTGR